MTSPPPPPFPRPPTALLALEGRDVELETLRAALLRARRSPLQLIWITGEAGVGKTALAAQLRQPAEQAGGHFAIGKCEQFGGGAPLQAPRQALAQLLAELVAGPEEAQLALAGMLRSVLGPDAGALLPVLPELGAITGPLPEPVALEPHKQSQRLLSLLRSLLGALTRQVRPLLLVLDDLHWADPLTLELISVLLDDPGQHGLLVLAIFRHTDVTPGTGLAQLLERTAVQPLPPLRLALANLSSEHLERLLVRRLRSEPDALAPLRDAIQRSTDGNPFFVHQLLNALKREGLLQQDTTGAWHWHEGPVRQRLSSGDVVAFLCGCLRQLPPASLEVLTCLGWLGSQSNLRLLAVASGQQLSQLPALLKPALEQGVLVCSQPNHLAIADPATVVGFGHDRLQQAVTNLAEAQRHNALQLAMARRLMAAGHHLLAAEHFAATTSLLSTPEECSQVITLLQQAGMEILEQGDFHAAEHFLQQSLALLGPEGWRRDPLTAFELQRGLHQLAYYRADYAEGDAIYAELLQRSHSPQQLLEPATFQVMALSNRGHYQLAVDLGADLLGVLGCHIPLGQLQLALDQELEAVTDLVAGGGLEVLPALPPLPSAGGSVITLLSRLVPAAFFCNPTLACWLVLNSSHQWLAGDAHPDRLYPLACTMLATVPARDDYATGYQAARTALAVGEASPYQAETARTRHVFSLLCQHWFEPLEQAQAQARRAHDDQLRCRDQEFACYTFYTTQAAELECGQDLADLAAENGRAVAFARRTCNRHAEPAFTAFTWLLNALQDTPAGAGTDRSIELVELSELKQLNPMAACYHHVYRALAAALLADVPCLRRHAEEASRLEPYITGFYPVALIRLLQGLALVEQLREGPDASASAALQDQQIWWASRSADAPQNFAHLAALLDAERLAALGQRLEALETYERSLRDAIAHQRPWHAALISERAGRCYLAFGLEQAGRRLLEQAHHRYEAWGASRKTAALVEEFPFLGPRTESRDDRDGLTALLQACQQLGRQRTVPELAQATAVLIAELSGASDVQILVLDIEGQWQIKGGLSPNGPLQRESLERADDQGLLPASALHLSLQLLHPLVLPDALLDPRVSGDRFFETMTCCSLLVQPVLVQHRPIAVLIAAHRQQRGAFVSGQTRPIGLLCGQLAVALESLLIQESLEQQVRERSQALEQAYAREVHNEERRRQLLEQKLKTSLTAAAFTHEIQQPLATILLRCGLAQQHLAGLPASACSTDLEQVLCSLTIDANQMVSTMERMRMLLRNVEMAHSSIDLAVILQSTLAFLRSEIEAQNVRLSHEGLDDACPLQGDATQLQTAAVNLIRNAIQAMEAQPAASRQLVLRLQRHPDQAKLVVADSGPGFPEGFDHETSWEVLKSTKATGMGLGLFLAQTAATNHHGQLRIGRCEILGGAEVVIELPLSASTR